MQQDDPASFNPLPAPPGETTQVATLHVLVSQNPTPAPAAGCDQLITDGGAFIVTEGGLRFCIGL